MYYLKDIVVFNQLPISNEWSTQQRSDIYLVMANLTAG